MLSEQRLHTDLSTAGHVPVQLSKSLKSDTPPVSVTNIERKSPTAEMTQIRSKQHLQGWVNQSCTRQEI